MKKTPPKNQPLLPEKPLKKLPAIKLNSTNQVILAAIVVLLIFIVAVMSSTPRQNVQTTTQPEPSAAAPVTTDGTMSGQQVARISITRSDSPQADVVGNGDGVSKTLTEIALDYPKAMVAGDRVKFKIDTFQKLAVQPLKFNLYDGNGMELTPEYLVTDHEVKLHMAIISANLREFARVFPEYSNGTWNVSANLPTPGTYYAYMKYKDVQGNIVMLQSELTVREPSKGTPNYPGLTPNNLAISGDVSAVLNLTDAGLENLSTLLFSLTRNGENVTNLRPHMGFFGHVMLVRHGDLLTVADAQPMPDTGTSKGLVQFGTQFHKAGRYTAFAEFKVGDKVLTFPITFDVQ